MEIIMDDDDHYINIKGRFVLKQKRKHRNRRYARIYQRSAEQRKKEIVRMIQRFDYPHCLSDVDKMLLDIHRDVIEERGEKPSRIFMPSKTFIKNISKR